MKKTFILLMIALLILAGFPKVFCEEEVVDEKDFLPIMGQGTLAREKMFLYLKNNNDENGLNPLEDTYIKEFVLTTIKESNKEGVNYDVTFALMMHETGFLNFGGDVLPSQNNFGGLGTTGGGVRGASFKDMKMGIRAVVQHLKCYGSGEELNNDLVDPRWSEALRSTAIYVEYLGHKDNPYGKGWAMPGEGYGKRLVERIEAINALDASKVDLDKIGTTNYLLILISLIALLLFLCIIYKVLLPKKRKRRRRI